MTPATLGLRGTQPYIPSWTQECGGNPALNTILENIDAWAVGIETDIGLLQTCCTDNAAAIDDIVNNIIPNLVLNDLADVDTASLNDNEVLTWNATLMQWVNAPAGTASPLTTKGDLYTFDTDNQRLPVGTSGQVLTVNPATATGLQWASPTALTFVRNEVPSGLVNGSNVNYTTASAYTSGSLQVYLNGQRLKGGGEDYTEVAGGFTMVVPPVTGDILLVDYAFNSGLFATGSASFVINETPSGTVNGSNTIFTTLFPYTANTLQVFRDGQLMLPGAGNDYVETTPGSGIFTFVTAPVSGSQIQVHYQRSLSVAGNADLLDGYHADPNISTDTIPVRTSLGRIRVNGLIGTGDIVLTPAASNIVKSQHNRQDASTNSVAANQVTQVGWGFITGNGANQRTSTVTFPQAYTSAPIVVVTQLGFRNNASAPTDITQFTTAATFQVGEIHTTAQSISTTGFQVLMDVGIPANWTSSIHMGYTWMAIGTIN